MTRTLIRRRVRAVACLLAPLFCGLALDAAAQSPKAPQLKPAQTQTEPSQQLHLRPLTAVELKAADKAFQRPEAILAFIQGYRENPQPRALPGVVKALVKHGVFRDGDTSGVYVGFVAGVLGTAGPQAYDLVEQLFPMPPEDQVGLVKAIAYSGHDEWKRLLLDFADRMPARRELIQRYLTGTLPSIDGLPLDRGSAPIDILWGRYYATGSYEPILRIISILVWSTEGNDVERLTIGSMAKFTLAQNAARDTDLLRLLKGARQHEGAKSRKILDEVIEAAELAEVGKIRQSALAAIDTLKARGPQDKRTHHWWGQVGQTALALGCVVAGAMGQAQVGIPCVIGGAVSTAALKLTEPQ